MSDSAEKKNTFGAHRITWVLVVVSLAAITTSGVMFYKYSKSQNTEQARQKQLITQLSKTIDLPTSTPTVVTVIDKTKLSNKTLAARVANQDMLLIYGSTKRIIVYRPSTKKVIDMLSFETQTELPAKTQATQPKS